MISLAEKELVPLQIALENNDSGYFSRRRSSTIKKPVGFIFTLATSLSLTGYLIYNPRDSLPNLNFQWYMSKGSPYPSSPSHLLVSRSKLTEIQNSESISLFDKRQKFVVRYTLCWASYYRAIVYNPPAFIKASLSLLLWTFVK